MEHQNLHGGATPPPISQTPPPVQAPPTDFGAFDDYYRKEFSLIHQSNGKYKGKWNWFAFLFSWIWLFSKGAWAYALIIIASLIITYGSNLYIFIGIGWALLCGLRGTWIMYNVKIAKRQMLKSLF